MLPAGMELRPGLQLNDRILAVGFPGESVPDPFHTEMVEQLRGVVARMEVRPGINALVVDLRNVPEITGPGIYSLKSLRTSLRERRVKAVLVVGDEDARRWLHGTGVTDHMRVVVGEEGLRAWLAQKAEDAAMFSEENIRKMLADNITLDDVIERLRKTRAGR
jgi:hypothetical protein